MAAGFTVSRENYDSLNAFLLERLGTERARKGSPVGESPSRQEGPTQTANTPRNLAFPLSRRMEFRQ